MYNYNHSLQPLSSPLQLCDNTVTDRALAEWTDGSGEQFVLQEDVLGRWFGLQHIQSYKQPLKDFKCFGVFWRIIQVEGVGEAQEEAAGPGQVTKTSQHRSPINDDAHCVGLVTHVDPHTLCAHVLVHLILWCSLSNIQIYCCLHALIKETHFSMFLRLLPPARRSCFSCYLLGKH